MPPTAPDHRKKRWGGYDCFTRCLKPGGKKKNEARCTPRGKQPGPRICLCGSAGLRSGGVARQPIRGQTYSIRGCKQSTTRSPPSLPARPDLACLVTSGVHRVLECRRVSRPTAQGMTMCEVDHEHYAGSMRRAPKTNINGSCLRSLLRDPVDIVHRHTHHTHPYPAATDATDRKKSLLFLGWGSVRRGSRA